MAVRGWIEGATETWCINKDHLDCGGIVELPRALDKDEPFVSTNREERSAHPAEGWVECPNQCGFAVWVAPK
jgi:hypothetical protein